MPQVRQMTRAVAQDLDAEKAPRVVPLMKLFPDKRVSEHIISSRTLQHDPYLQEKLVERAAITLQKMQRKRVLHQRVDQESRLQATTTTTSSPITLQQMQRKNILAHSLAVGKVQCNDTCRLQTASVLTVSSLLQVSPIGCVV